MALKLASGSYDNTIRFWDPSTGSSNPNPIKLNSAPNRIEISEDKNRMVVGMNNCVKLFELNRPDQPVRSFDTEFKGNVTAVGFFNKQNKLIYTACEDGAVKIFDISSKAVVKQKKHSKPINCAILHPKEDSILSGDEEGHLRIWDINMEKKEIVL